MEKTIEIDLREIFTLLLRKVWIIVICAVLGGMAAYFYTVCFVKPLYNSNVRIYVNNSVNTQNASGITSSDLTTSQRLVSTYINILQSNTVLEMVAEEAQVELSPNKLLTMIDASSMDGTEVFWVVVSDTDPERAAKIANAIATVAPDAIANIVEGSSTKVIDYARVADKPYSPDYWQNTLLGVTLGAVLAVLVIVLRMLLDVRVNSEEDLLRISSAPVLGVIPDFDSDLAYEHGYESETAGRTPGKAVKR